MAWTADGQKICIVYEDGAIIVGSVDGNRIWGKELKNTALTGVQWSPDGRLLLFSIRNGELHLYDNQGTFVMKLNIQCVHLGPSRSLSVVGVCWFSGHGPSNRPVLAICYENGKMQFMRNENDDGSLDQFVGCPVLIARLTFSAPYHRYSNADSIVVRLEPRRIDIRSLWNGNGSFGQGV